MKEENWMSGVEQTIPFAMIPRAFIEDSRTKAYHLAAFAALSSFANRSGECWPGVDKVRGLAGIGKNKWPEVLRELQEWGWIDVIHRHTEDGRQLSNKYRLHGRPSIIRDEEGSEMVTPSPPKGGHKQEPVEQEPENYKSNRNRSDCKHETLNVPMNSTRYQTLCGQYSQAAVDTAIQERMDWEATKGKPQAKDYAAAAATWLKNAEKFESKKSDTDTATLMKELGYTDAAR